MTLVVALVIGATVLAQSESKEVRVLITCSGCENLAPNAEAVKVFKDKCPEFAITIHKEKADYVVVADHTGAGLMRNPRNTAVFNPEGDVILTTATKSLGGAMKDACKAIRKDLTAK